MSQKSLSEHQNDDLYHIDQDDFCVLTNESDIAETKLSNDDLCHIYEDDFCILTNKSDITKITLPIEYKNDNLFHLDRDDFCVMANELDAIKATLTDLSVLYKKIFQDEYQHSKYDLGQEKIEATYKFATIRDQFVNKLLVLNKISGDKSGYFISISEQLKYSISRAAFEFAFGDPDEFDNKMESWFNDLVFKDC